MYCLREEDNIKGPKASIAIEANGVAGIFESLDMMPIGPEFRAFLAKQTEQERTKVFTSLLRPGHQNSSRMRALVFLMPRWPPSIEEW